MKKFTSIFIIIIILTVLSENLAAREGFGAGLDFNPNAVRISARHWFSKMDGFELGFGPSCKLEDFKFDDLSIQAKFMKGIFYDRYRRGYVGAVARYTFIKDPFFDKNLPAAGIFGGNEWYLGRFRNQGIAIEGGVMYGKVKKDRYLVDADKLVPEKLKEFPLFLTFSYKYYFR